MLRRRLLASALAALPLHRATAQRPQPDGPVALVVPYTPGTAQDLLARLLAPALGVQLGQPVVVDNRAGASGLIGTGAVARAAPDGRTLMVNGVPFVMNPTLLRNLPYDPARSFTALVRLAVGHVMLAVRPDLPVRSIAEFLALARARPGELDYASPGNGTAQHMTMELFRLAAGITLNHVPYRGTAPAVQDLIGRRVAAMMLPVSVVLPLMRAGQVRVLAIGAATRSSEAPEVPTFAEAGAPYLAVDAWFGLFAPARTPALVIARLSDALPRILAEPETSARLAQLGFQPAPLPAAAFAVFQQAEVARWRELVALTGVRLEG